MEPLLLVVIGGLLALVGSISTQLLALLATANTTRLRANLNGKTAAYTELAGLAVRLRAACLHPGVEQSRAIIKSGFATEADWYSLQAKVEVYGSESVRKAFSDLLSHRTKVLSSIEEWESIRESHDEQAKESLDHMRACKKEAVAAACAILDSVNGELRN